MWSTYPFRHGQSPEQWLLTKLRVIVRLGGVLGVELGSFLWIIFLFKYLKKARMIQTNWIMLLVSYVLSSIVIGPGATLLLA
jgi:hypothetical protein